MTPFEKWWKRYQKNQMNKGIFDSNRLSEESAKAAWEACARKSKKIVADFFNKQTSEALKKAMEPYI